MALNIPTRKPDSPEINRSRLDRDKEGQQGGTEGGAKALHLTIANGRSGAPVSEPDAVPFERDKL